MLAHFLMEINNLYFMEIYLVVGVTNRVSIIGIRQVISLCLGLIGHLSLPNF
jgi:hypothetical protein